MNVERDSVMKAVHNLPEDRGLDRTKESARGTLGVDSRTLAAKKFVLALPTPSGLNMMGGVGR